MTNPYLAPGVAAWPNSPGGSGTDALSALANNVAKGLGKPPGFDGTQKADLLSAPIKFTSGTITGSPNGTGTVSLYLILSEDGITWSNGIDPTSTSDQSSLIGSLPLLLPSIVVTTTATAYYFPWFSVMEVLGSPTMPSYASLLVYNQSGAAFATTSGGNNAAKYNLISYS